MILSAQHNQRLTRVLSAAAFALVLLLPSLVLAADTMGNLVCNIANQMYDPSSPAASIANFFNGCAYIVGAVLIAGGIYKLRDYSSDPSRSHLTPALAALVGGSMLMSLPFSIGWAVNTVYGGAGGGGGFTACAPGAVTTYSSSTSDPGVIVTNVLTNIKQPLWYVLNVAAYTIGVFFIFRGLLKASKYGTDPRTASVPAIVSNLVFGAALFSVGQSEGMVLTSLFGASSVTDSSHVDSWDAVSNMGSTSFTAVVKSVLNFFQVVGMIAFIRGWMVLKAVAEGGGQATIAQGMTHILGGAMAINIFYVLEIFDATMGMNFLQ